MRILFTPAALFCLAAVMLCVAAMAVDLGFASRRYGPEYVRRLVLWRRPDPVDRLRFPVRAIAAAAVPSSLPRNPAGEAAVRDAFARIRGAGWSGPNLERTLAAAGTTSLLVLQHGRLVFEGYYNGHGPRTPQNSFSMAKSVTALLAGAAIADGLLPPVDTPAEAVLPQVPGLRGSGVTLRNLLDMTSGFRLDNHRPFGPYSLPWSANQVMHFAPDLRAVAAAAQPEAPPGTRFLYDDRNAMLVGMALERATGESVSRFLERRLWQPMGAACPADWILDSDATGFEKMETGLAACAEDWVRLGALVLRGGQLADGTRLLPPAWIAALGQPASSPAEFTPHFVTAEDMARESYGLFWWSIAMPSGPRDVYASGLFGQALYVSHARDTVALRTGDAVGGIPWQVVLRDLVWALPTGRAGD